MAIRLGQLSYLQHMAITIYATGNRHDEVALL